MKKPPNGTSQLVEPIKSSESGQGETQAAINWSKKAGLQLKDQATKFGKKAMDSDIGKAAAKGAAVGAVVAIPIPLIGPIAGAVVGAGIGAFLSVKHGIGESPNPRHHSQPPLAMSHASEDVIGNLERLQQLRQTGAITESEFEEQKAKLLRRI